MASKSTIEVAPAPTRASRSSRVVGSSVGLTVAVTSRAFWTGPAGRSATAFPPGFAPTLRGAGAVEARHAAQVVRVGVLLRLVEAVLLVGGGTEPEDGLHRGGDHPGEHEGEGHHGDHADDLVPSRDAAAAEEEAVLAERVDAAVAEEAEQQRAEHAADEVHREDVQRVVEPEQVLQPQREVADEAGDARRWRWRRAC